MSGITSLFVFKAVRRQPYSERPKVVSLQSECEWQEDEHCLKRIRTEAHSKHVIGKIHMFFTKQTQFHKNFLLQFLSESKKEGERNEIQTRIETGN